MAKPFIYFGTPEVARDTLSALLKGGYRPILVVSSPDARRGRGMRLLPSPTKELAEKEGIPVITPEKLDAATLDLLRASHASYALVVAYGKILPETLLNLFPLGVLNVHYSLLPKYRGASPMEAALRNGETQTGVTIQKMVKALDAGDVLTQEVVPIHNEETGRELRPRLIERGAALLLATLPAFEEGRATFTPQDERLVTHCGKYTKEDGLLDLAADAETNWNTYRAYADTIGTYIVVERNGVPERLKIRTARYENGMFIPERVVREGGKEVSYEEYLRS